MNIAKVRSLRNVRRFNFEFCNHYQSVAEHSFFVALLAHQIAKIVGVSSWHAMEAGLFHDLAESVTGDIPFLVRRSLDPVALATLDHKAEIELGVDLSYPRDILEVVSYADALDCAIYLKEERESGNTTLLDIEKETLGRLKRKIGNKWAPEWVFAAKLLGVKCNVETKGITNELKH